MHPELSLDGGWSMGEASFEAIVRRIERRSASVVVEFGSGASSVRLALALPGVQILSIEHDPAHHETTMGLRRRHAPRSSLSVSLRPLEWQWHFGGPFYTYRAGELPEAVDVVVIDGPPHYCHRGREACLYQAHSRLDVGGMVILDDHGREEERRMASNWDRVFPGQFTTQIIDVGHELCVKERTHRAPGRRSVGISFENCFTLARKQASRLAGKIHRARESAHG